MRSIEMAGKTVEDAVRLGLKELGCDSSDVTIDVLDMGSPGLFGMFGHLAKVRLTVKEDTDDFKFEMPSMSISSKPEPARKSFLRRGESAKKAEKAEPVKTEAPKEVRPVEAAPAAEAPAAEPIVEEESVPEAAPVRENPVVREAAPRREKPARREKASRKAPAATEAPAQPAPGEPALAWEDLPATDEATLEGEAKIAYEFLKNVTTKMGVGVDIRVKMTDEQLIVKMNGDTLGILIGRRGDTLDALQYLTSLQVNKDRDKYLRVSLDTENYRAKREEALRALANRMANRVRKSGRRMALEPMNPYERRVLHSALQNNPYVTTHSEGEDPYRRVVITPKEQ